jgi:hypothetical protein
LTAQGSPRSIFKRAIEHGNFVVAEMTAHDVGRLTLSESLALTSLAAQKAPERRSRYTVRWLRRLLEEDANLMIEEAALAASAWQLWADVRMKRHSRPCRPWGKGRAGQRPACETLLHRRSRRGS